MADVTIPKLGVLITPEFDSNAHAVSLLVSLIIESPALLQDQILVTFPSTFSCVCTEQELDVSDEQGALPIVFEDQEKSADRSWLPARKSIGDVRIRYKVIPSAKDQFKTDGPVLGLHSEKGGLLGSGFALIPVPPPKEYRNIVQWDLSRAPKGTRAVWTYGEGPRLIERVGAACILRDSVYMVGQIEGTRAAANYGYYWFGNLPPNIEVIKDIHESFFTHVQKFFETDVNESEDIDHPFFANVPKGIKQCLVEPTPHRSFVRYTSSYKSFGGTSFGHSHIFNYDDQIGKAKDYDLIRRMAYEMSHIWLGPSAVEGVDWLYEGIKNCLSIYMPFRHQGPRSGHYFQATINMLCTRYYTSPLISLPFEDILKLAPTNAYAREHVGARAWAFVVGVDMRARQLAKGKLKTIRPVEDIAMIPLANNKSRGDAHGIKEWIKFLIPIMGGEIQQRYDDFCNGTIILLPESLYGAKTHYLKQFDQPILDFGMDRESFSTGVVTGLKMDSRAGFTGLMDGDEILRSSHEWRCVDDDNAAMDLEIVKKGVRRKIRYLPRAFEMAKSWEMVKRDEQELKAFEESLATKVKR
ncbi:hypothetical protein BKA64DRAFT_446872 [Cadophora sp. MPI-SDFR-AT-0126]|nr:hypothetical protein BKA64DRAFT_446872 [Leotiomycetes sp. MPI-SDFR-AT-0126]